MGNEKREANGGDNNFGARSREVKEKRENNKKNKNNNTNFAIVGKKSFIVTVVVVSALLSMLMSADVIMFLTIASSPFSSSSLFSSNNITMQETMSTTTLTMPTFAQESQGDEVIGGGDRDGSGGEPFSFVPPPPPEETTPPPVEQQQPPPPPVEQQQPPPPLTGQQQQQPQPPSTPENMNCPPGEVPSRLQGGPPCIRYDLVYPEELRPEITLSCDNGDPNRIRLEVNGLRPGYAYLITHIYPPNSRVLDHSPTTDSAGHSSLVTSSVSYIGSLNAGRHTLVFYAGPAGSLEQHSITFDIQYPFDCNRPVTLNLNAGNAGIPEDIIHPPRAIPPVKYGNCKQGQEQTTSSLIVGNTICIPPGYAAFIGCKRIEAPASIIAYGYPSVGFSPTLSIRGYVFGWYPLTSNIVDQGSRYITGCAEPRLIPVGAHFAADETSSIPVWQFTGRNGDCEGTAEASRIYICTLVNTYRAETRPFEHDQ
jgi:hypothetical protein